MPSRRTLPNYIYVPLHIHLEDNFERCHALLIIFAWERRVINFKLLLLLLLLLLLILGLHFQDSLLLFTVSWFPEQGVIINNYYSMSAHWI